jgi:signal transduction histidine kinase
LAACKSDGIWNESAAPLAFTVTPFVWQTWWFRATAVIAFTLSVGAIVWSVSSRRLRFKLRMLEQQSALDKERARIARDLHDDLGGSLTQVSLLLDMTQRDFGATEQAGLGLQQCSIKVQQVVESVDEIIWAINPRNDTARYSIDYLSQFAVEFLYAANIPCRVELPEQIPELTVSPEARHNLFLVVKESLNNIARHAQASEVRLRVAVTEKSIGIIIEDNGNGFERPSANVSADGLRNMRQRMEEISGQFQIESKEGMGTRVSLLYPWPQKK